MKIVSWNVNGLKSCLTNHALEPVYELKPDLICFQETKTNERPIVVPGFHHFWNSSVSAGYAGVLSISRHKPIDVVYGMGDADLDQEGRLITLEYEQFYSVNAYFPKSQASKLRHRYRMEWDQALRERLVALDMLKPVILCGDFNITRSLLDVYPENERQVWAENGYMSEERENLEELLESGFTDAFRSKHPELPGAYTWWSNRLNKRNQNRGWRLDYFCVSDQLASAIKDIRHHTEIMGSDHCPIALEIDI